MFPKAGWTGVLVAARHGFGDIVRELITKYGCDRNAVIEVYKWDLSVDLQGRSVPRVVLTCGHSLAAAWYQCPFPRCYWQPCGGCEDIGWRVWSDSDTQRCCKLYLA